EPDGHLAIDWRTEVVTQADVLTDAGVRRGELDRLGTGMCLLGGRHGHEAGELRLRPERVERCALETVGERRHVPGLQRLEIQPPGKTPGVIAGTPLAGGGREHWASSEGVRRRV